MTVHSETAPVLCTIIAKNYLAQARALAESFYRYHPDGRLFVLLVDRPDGLVQLDQEKFTVIQAEDLGIADFQQMAFYYNVLELSTAVKPFFIEYLFERYQLEHVAYFDPDIYFYAPITPILAALQDAEIVMTPHLLEPNRDDKKPSDLDILRVGAYNFGFVAFSRGPRLLPLLRWWQARLKWDCVHDLARGLFVDQRWADLFPSFFEKVAILRHPGCNAAYWNLAQREVTFEAGRWMVNGQPLVFFHFSGLDFANLRQISKYQDRLTLDSRPEIGPLFEAYRERLAQLGYAELIKLPYSFGFFDNGVKIPEPARRMFRHPSVQQQFPNPMHVENGASMIDWLNAPAEGLASPRLLVSNLAMALYHLRPDVQSSYPDARSSHQLAYARWFASDGGRQHQLDPYHLKK